MTASSRGWGTQAAFVVLLAPGEDRAGVLRPRIGEVDRRPGHPCRSGCRWLHALPLASEKATLKISPRTAVPTTLLIHPFQGTRPFRKYATFRRAGLSFFQVSEGSRVSGGGIVRCGGRRWRDRGPLVRAQVLPPWARRGADEAPALGGGHQLCPGRDCLRFRL